jgi:hypothetical protein
VAKSPNSEIVIFIRSLQAPSEPLVTIEYTLCDGLVTGMQGRGTCYVPGRMAGHLSRHARLTARVRQIGRGMGRDMGRDSGLMAGSSAGIVGVRG